MVDVPLGEPVQELVQRDLSFEPCEVRAQAVVEPVAEREVLDVVAADVVGIWVGVAAGSTVGRHEQSRIGLPAGAVVAVVLDVLVT